MTSTADEIRSNEDFEKCYEVGEFELGKGGFGRVFSGKRLVDDLPVAIKYIEKIKVTNYERGVPFEITILLKVGAIPGVIKLLDWFELPDKFLIVLERPIPSKDLFDYISEKVVLDETTAKLFLRQIVGVVTKCHEAGIVHRDLKDENILVEFERYGYELKPRGLKLIDFGCAAYIRDSPYTDYEGTQLYAPPEWFRDKSYDGPSATVWSLGVLLYDMVSGDIPFDEPDKILEASVEFKGNLSIDCRDLIKKCLNVQSSARPTLKEILDHQWMSTE